MEKPIFNLLTEISKIEYFDNEDKSGRSNREQMLLVSEKERQLTYLLQQGFISKTREIYIITEYGYHVAQFKSWNDYLIHQKSLFDQKLKKEKYDLYISWFQYKTGWLPYLVSVIGLVFSIYAYNNSKEKPRNKETTQQNNKSTQKSIKEIDSSTKNTLNEKVVNKDTFHLKNLKN